MFVLDPPVVTPFLEQAVHISTIAANSVAVAGGLAAAIYWATAFFKKT